MGRETNLRGSTDIDKVARLEKGAEVDEETDDNLGLIRPTGPMRTTQGGGESRLEPPPPSPSPPHPPTTCASPRLRLEISCTKTETSTA